jgi:hypothetical protein
MDKTQQKAIWRERVTEWERSGQSVPAFCRQRHLPTWSLYQWRKRLGPTPVRRSQRTTRFVEISLPSVETPAWACELELNNGRKLRFRGGVPAQQVAALAAALEGGVC